MVSLTRTRTRGHILSKNKINVRLNNPQDVFYLRGTDSMDFASFIIFFVVGIVTHWVGRRQVIVCSIFVIIIYMMNVETSVDFLMAEVAGIRPRIVFYKIIPCSVMNRFPPITMVFYLPISIT